MKNSTICLIKDENHEVVFATTNWHIAAETLAKAHNDAVEDGSTPDEEFADSLSGYHCSIWSENGKCLAVYGEDNSRLIETNFLSVEEVEEDMFNVLSFAFNPPLSDVEDCE